MLLRRRKPAHQAAVTAAPSLASDLSWLLVGRSAALDAGPVPAAGRDVRRPRGPGGRGSTASGATARRRRASREMQVLAQPTVAHRRVRTPRRCGGPSRAPWPTMPLDLDMPSETPEDAATVPRAASAGCGESPDLLRVVSRPPRGGLGARRRHVAAGAARHRGGRASCGRAVRAGTVTGEHFYPMGCDILARRMPAIGLGSSRASWSCCSCPACSSATSMYLEFPGLVVIGIGVGQDDVVARARTDSVARGSRRWPTHPTGHPPLSGHRAEHGRRAGRALPAGPAHGQHARQGPAPERAGALGASGRPAAAERRSRRRSSRSSASSARRSSAARSRGRRCRRRPSDSGAAAGASTTGNERMPATVVEQHPLGADRVTA